jgi:hypothetical protein
VSGQLHAPASLPPGKEPLLNNNDDDDDDDDDNNNNNNSDYMLDDRSLIPSMEKIFLFDSSS